MSTAILPPQQIAPTPVAESDWSLGWRYERVRTANGKEEEIRVPLTPAEALHPQEGYTMPVRTLHDRVADDLCDMLRPHCEQQADVAVFHDLVFVWDHPEIGNYAPDVAVVPNVRNRAADRGTFEVATEETRPSLVIEIVSPKTREADRVKKVKDYALVGIQEYIYIDHTTRRGKESWEIAGFRLDGDRYLPMLPDEDGAYFCETVGLCIGMEDGQVWLEDVNTGEDLLTNQKVRKALATEEEGRKAAEARVAELEAQLEALRRQQT